MTQKEIQEKVRSTFRKGDRVFIRITPTIGEWYLILDIDYKSKKVSLEKKIILTFSEAIEYLSFTEYTLEPVGFSQERPKSKKKNGDPFEVGDEVWFIHLRGIKKGKVVSVYNTCSETYPVFVTENGEDVSIGWSFTTTGKYREEDDITLFHQKPIITFED